MDGSELISVQIVGSHGLVWSIPDVLKLRTQHRLVGSMVGGVTGFKNQVAVGGLPLQLTPEEVTLALRAGWVQLYQTSFSIPTAKAAAEQEAAAAQTSSQAKQQPDALVDDEEFDEYYAAYYGLPPPQQQQQQDEQQQQDAQQQQAAQQDSLHQQQQQGPAPWQTAIATGECFELPLTVGAGSAAAGQDSSSSPAGAAAALQPVLWTYPQTPAEQLRQLVFQDLHSKGYYLTNGAKFGGDYLAYPGDPALYHAQFVVRVLAPQLSLNPVVLKALARGVHSARKHLLLATAEIGDQPQQQQQQQGSSTAAGATAAGCVDGAGAPPVMYISVAKEDGFGASKQQ